VDRTPNIKDLFILLLLSSSILSPKIYVLCLFTRGSLRERDHWEDPDVDGRRILRGIFRKWEGVVGTGWSGLRIGTGGEHFGFHKCGKFLD
jgi:hypothetical protein